LKLEDIHKIKVPEDYEVNEEGFWDCIRTEKPFAFGMMKEVYLMKKKNAT
jgi:myosin protein heavy chain